MGGVPTPVSFVPSMGGGASRPASHVWLTKKQKNEENVEAHVIHTTPHFTVQLHGSLTVMIALRSLNRPRQWCNYVVNELDVEACMEVKPRDVLGFQGAFICLESCCEHLGGNPHRNPRLLT
jgi:hypothetical protein